MELFLFNKLCWRFGIMPPKNEKQDAFLSLFFSATSKSKIKLDYLFHTFYAGFKTELIRKEGEEVRPFLEMLTVQKARQRYRPDFFSHSMKSSLAINEVEDIWLCISQRDDWSKFEEKIKNIKKYAIALRMD